MYYVCKGVSEKSDVILTPFFCVKSGESWAMFSEVRNYATTIMRRLIEFKFGVKPKEKTNENN